jgi:ParB-like chromosome segregation protein Spo0J
MTETLDRLDDDARRLAVQIEAKLLDWNIPYEYDPEMPIAEIRRVEAAQTRTLEHLADASQIERYTAQMEAGAVFPPILLLNRDLLLDGNTRLAAAKKLRRKTIPAFHADFPNGELGRSFAAALNQQNGRPLSTEEAHRAALSLLSFGHTEESVAREIGYSRTAIGHWRKEKEFSERTKLTRTENKAAGISRIDQRKLADIKLSTPFAAVLDLVADVRPKTSLVTELVKAVQQAPSEADALEVVAKHRAEMVPAGPPPHRTAAAPELQAVRRSLPQLVNAAHNPMLLLESADDRKHTSIDQWQIVKDLATRVLDLYSA